jgi:hypothetical protein
LFCQLRREDKIGESMEKSIPFERQADVKDDFEEGEY